MNLSWIDDDCWNFTNVFKHAESIVVICNHWVISERMEISTLKENLCASSIWTTVWYQRCDGWLRIVPVKECVLWILLIIEWNSKGNRFFYDIWKWRYTNHVIWINECGCHWFSSERASCVLIKIQEVLSPNLDNRLSILWAVSRIDGEDLCRLVISEGDRVCDILEVACQTDSKWQNFRFSWCRTVITLQASFILKLN